MPSTAITSAHFGAVFRSLIAFERPEFEAPGQDDNIYQGSSFDYVVDSVGLTSIRFPGGGEPGRDGGSGAGDRFWDWTVAEDIERLHKIIDYAADEGLDLQFTFSARDFNDPFTTAVDYSQVTDPNAFQVAFDVNQRQQEIKDFFTNDLLQYAHDRGVDVNTIKIGNEYLGGNYFAPPKAEEAGTGGIARWNFAARNYGEVSGLLAKVIGEALDDFEAQSSTLSSWSRPNLMTEATANQWFFDGLREVLTDAEIKDLFTAVDLHHPGQSLGATYDNFAAGGSRTIRDNFEDDMAYFQNEKNADNSSTFGDLKFENEAWAYPDSGISHAALSVMQFHAMSLVGVESATQFQAFGDSGASMTGTTWGNSNNGAIASELHLSPGGESFAMMRDTLEGLTAISKTDADEQEVQNAIDNGGPIVRAFGADGRMVLYIINPHSTALGSVSVNAADYYDALSGFNGFNAGNGHKSTLLGLVPGTASLPQNREPIQSDVTANVNGSTLSFSSLGAHEMIQIELTAHGAFLSNAGTFNGASTSATYVEGSDGNDTINTKGGDDSIFSGEGRDTINSKWGDDLVDAGAGNDTVDGGAGNNLIYLGDGNDTYKRTSSGSSTDTVWGGSGRDKIDLDDGADFAHGEEGNDTIKGFNGDDELHGGAGADRVYGGNQNDTIFGGSGNDKLFGQGGVDFVFGNAGNDEVRGGSGNDAIDGGIGDDVLVGGTGKDLLTGGADADVFQFKENEMATSHTNADHILDFEFNGVDKIKLIGLTFDNPNDPFGGWYDAANGIFRLKVEDQSGDRWIKVSGNFDDHVANSSGQAYRDLMFDMDNFIFS